MDEIYQRLLLCIQHYFKGFQVSFVYNDFFDCWFYNFDFEDGVLNV